MFKKIVTTIALAAALGSTHGYADVVDDSFYPYRDSVPSHEGLNVGMTINASNVDQFKDILDSAVFDQLKNGLWEMKVAETTSFGLHENYVSATRKNLGKVSLGEGLGQINNFMAGRPFPEEPSTDDPRAGEKLAWNYKYGYNWGDSAAISPFYWKYRDLDSGKVERTLKFSFHFLNYKHRVQHEPIPEFPENPSDLFRAIYVQVLEPFDVKNTQLLIHRAENDLVRDNTWLYLGFQRRVRRLATGQITDSFLGADIMIEDFEGYNSRISDMNWSYKGTQNLLLPFYNHNDQVLATDLKESDGYQFVDFGGQGGCFPNISWQLRKVYVLEADPIDDNHPISKRTHYVDAQTFTLPRTLIYDRKGDLWKSWIIGQAHPDHHMAKNKGTGVSIDDAFSMLDVQAGHCTTGQFKGQVDPEMNQVKLFTVQNMRAKGR
ncbi:DUF1329 domain-containing protein [Halieaceae bacterium IMCC8485]|uniref:DUF1329 domain-containing protein n=1 Tax=Candidatus Seongchinamella marina TaxID=2518990 RepID=A0ABT3SZT0_9GAMM|nr:DUF1329 domain-containing protein [Candidatus Seongchinamella marina]MCX2975508.1 DUF1329 domain-containing protein [Candidatus Seongchinamella marina]